jgi:hypothetical protein
VTVSPTTATIPAGSRATSQIVPQVTISLSTPGLTGSYTLTATDSGFATDATPAVVTVNRPAITFLNSGSPLTVGAGMRVNFVSIALDTPAPAGGLTVNLASTDSTIATVPPSIVIPVGATSGSFSVSGISTGANATGTVQVTASAQGWTSQTLNVTVVQPVLLLSGIQTSRTVNGPVNTFSVVACVSAGNCADAMTAALGVTLDVGTTTIVTVNPTQTTIAAGASTSPQISLSSPTAAGTYTVTASAPGFSPVSIVVTVT